VCAVTVQPQTRKANKNKVDGAAESTKPNQQRAPPRQQLRPSPLGSDACNNGGLAVGSRAKFMALLHVEMAEDASHEAELFEPSASGVVLSRGTRHFLDLG